MDAASESLHGIYAEGCEPDLTLVLRDTKGHVLARLWAVRSILSSWSPVLRDAMEMTESPSPSSPGTPIDSQVHHLSLTVSSHKEVEAWEAALCLMHPLKPTCGKTPASLMNTQLLQPLVALADKYNIQGLLPLFKDVLLDPRTTFGVSGINSSFCLDAMEWLSLAEGVPGFEPVISRCIAQIVSSCTSPTGRTTRSTNSFDMPRYRGSQQLTSCLMGLRPETAAKLATSLASCLAVAAEHLPNQERYSLKPVGDSGGWEYAYEPRK